MGDYIASASPKTPAPTMPPSPTKLPALSSTKLPPTVPSKLTPAVADGDVDAPALPITNSAAAPARQQQGSNARGFLARTFGSSSFVVVCIILAELLALAFFITLLVVDHRALQNQYDGSFRPQSYAAYKNWGIVTLVFVGLFIVLAFFAIDGTKSNGNRVVLLIVSLGYAALLVTGNVYAESGTAMRRNGESVFAARYNDFYCNVRTARVCLEGDSATLLQLTRGNATTVQAGENAVDVSVAVWKRCQSLLAWGIDRTGRSVRTSTGSRKLKDGVIAIDTDPLFDFLDDSTGSSETDVWCGDVYRRDAEPSDAEQRAKPAPYASNTKFYSKYTKEWTKRMAIANGMLGTVIALLLLALFGYTVM